VRRGLKLGLGIPLVVIGIFVTLAGAVLTVVVGPDGRFTLPRSTAHADGRALIYDGLSLRGMRSSGTLAATVDLTVRDDDGEDPIFVGIGPRTAVRRYLHGVTVDRLVQISWPGGVRTETVPGTATQALDPPADQPFWVASDAGTSATVEWVAASGDWTIVVMNADGTGPVDVVGQLAIRVPAFGPASIVLLVLGVLMLVGGAWLTISGARMPRPARDGGVPPPPRPDPAAGS
jgi:hypothetical protein